MKQLLTIAVGILLSFIVSETSFAQDKVYSDPEVMPEIVGGISALAANITYPEEAKENNVQGKVFIKVVLDEKGGIIRTEVEKKVNPLLDKAALDAVSKTKFTAGKEKGKAVKCEIIIPVAFKLK